MSKNPGEFCLGCLTFFGIYGKELFPYFWHMSLMIIETFYLELNTLGYIFKLAVFQWK